MKSLPKRSLILRTAAFDRLRASIEDLSELFAFPEPYSHNQEIVIYGPYFDYESLLEVSGRLVLNGLEFWDDFMEVDFEWPEWLEFSSFGSNDPPPQKVR